MGVSEDMRTAAEVHKPSCFVPGTILHMADGSFKDAFDLGVGDSLLSLEGGVTQLVWKQIEDGQLREVVEIITRRGCHKFTAKHRVTVACDAGTIHQVLEA